jgi:hypothetical protein
MAPFFSPRTAIWIVGDIFLPPWQKALREKKNLGKIIFAWPRWYKFIPTFGLSATIRHRSWSCRNKHNRDVWMVGKMDSKIRETRNLFCGNLSNIGIVIIAACISSRIKKQN